MQSIFRGGVKRHDRPPPRNFLLTAFEENYRPSLKGRVEVAPRLPPNSAAIRTEPHRASFPLPASRFAHLPTPLEPMERLSKHLGGPRLWIKRDDCTGLSERRQQDPQARIPDGARRWRRAPTRDHARRDAVEPRAPDRRRRGKLGLECHLLLEDRTGIQSTRLHAERQRAARPPARRASVAASRRRRHERGDGRRSRTMLRAKGETPYVIPGGGSNPIGALGYVNCAFELVAQANELGLEIDACRARDRQRRHAGGLGHRARRDQLRHSGARHRRARAAARSRRRTCSSLPAPPPSICGCPASSSASTSSANCDYVGAGYGSPRPGHGGSGEDARAISKASCSIRSIPAKAWHGLIDLVRKGFFEKGQRRRVPAHRRLRPGCSATSTLSISSDAARRQSASSAAWDRRRRSISCAASSLRRLRKATPTTSASSSTTTRRFPRASQP